MALENKGFFADFPAVFLWGKFFGNSGFPVASIPTTGIIAANDGFHVVCVAAGVALGGRKCELHSGCVARRAGLISAWARG